MAKRRQRRAVTEHRGVKLKARELPSGRRIWLARWRDPESGKDREVSLDKLGHTTREARRQWAIRKARELSKAREAVALGLPPAAPEPSGLEAAITQYLDGARARLRPKTLTTYGLAFAKLREWAEKERVTSTADLTPARLASLREHLIRAPKHAAKRRGRRGEQKGTKALRSPVSVNRELRSIKTLLGAWRMRGLLPHLHRDDISDALAALPISREEPPFLRAAQLRKLLAAALRHDAATYDATREEHAGRRTRGTTARYVPIAPFVAFLVLTGMRRGEALACEWSMVDLDALDHEGRTVGEIRLPARVTKTKTGRTIGLEVSPALRSLLAAMKVQARNERARAGLDPEPLGFVFGGEHPYTADLVQAARRRLLRPPEPSANEMRSAKGRGAPAAAKPRVTGYGAPEFDWQTLRSTCATYLTNAPGIFGAATAFMSAKQLGHSVQVAERHYLGVHRGIPRDARTLEAAMQIEGELRKVRAAGEAGEGTARDASVLALPGRQ